MFNRFLITGSSGFIGSYIVRHIVENNLGEVIALIGKDTDLWRISDLISQIRLIKCNYNQIDAITDQICSANPDTLIHAGWSGVINNDRNSIVQLNNIKVMVDLLKLCESLGIRNFVGLGSQAEYGIPSGRVNESHPNKPTTLYGATKFSAYVAAQKTCELHDIRFKWIRVFSTFGPKDNPEWFFPYLINSLLSNKTPDLTGCEQLWDFLFVKDAAEAIVKVSVSPVASGVYNLGSGKARELRTIVELVKSQLNSDTMIHYGAKPYRDDQVMHLEADISKLQTDIHWKPRFEIEQAISETVQWYKSDYHQQEND